MGNRTAFQSQLRTQVLENLRHILSEEAIGTWLNTPRPELNDRTPLWALTRGGTKMAHRVLEMSNYTSDRPLPQLGIARSVAGRATDIDNLKAAPFKPGEDHGD